MKLKLVVARNDISSRNFLQAYSFFKNGQPLEISILWRPRKAGIVDAFAVEISASFLSGPWTFL